MSIDLKDDILNAVKESRFIKHKCKTPKFRKPTVPPQYNPPPMPPVKPLAKTNPPNTGSSVVKPNPNYIPPPSVAKPEQKKNKTMYGLKLYIPFEDLDAYIHEQIETADLYPTFVPIKAEVNECDLGIEISLVSAVPNEFYGRRYKLGLNKLPKEN